MALSELENTDITTEAFNIARTNAIHGSMMASFAGNNYPGTCSMAKKLNGDNNQRLDHPIREYPASQL